MPDSSNVDAALTAKLLADATLMALATDGVYFDEATAGKTKFVILSLVTESDEPMFGARAFEDATYLVKYVELGTSGINAKAAAARIDVLLEQGTLTVTGYGLMVMRRVERVRYTEVDDVDSSIRWQHRGGRYQIVVST
jgi:hypothetical protein